VNQQVNLYHPIFRREEKKFSAATMLQAGLLVLTGIVLMYGYSWWRIHALRVDLKDIDFQHAAALARLTDVSKKLPMRHGDVRLEQEVRDLERRIQVVQQIRTYAKRDLFRGSAGYSGYLVAMARQSIGGLWLTGLTIIGAGEQLVLSGRTTSPELVPGYLQRLAGEKSLAGMQFEVFQMTRPERKPANAEKNAEAVLEPYVEFVVRTSAPEKPK
jgi:hypothetical protein